MIDFSDKVYANILAEQLARVSNSIDKREGSIIQTALGPESWYIEGIYLALAQLQKNSFALSAVGQYLEYKVAERGLARKEATPSKRLGVFNVPVPLRARLSTINGDASITFYVSGGPIESSDGYNAELTAEIAGSIGNEYTGTLLPITFIPGLTEATVTTIERAGTDEEDDISLLQRYLNSLKEQPFAGNIAAYRQAILTQSEVGAVQIYPVWRGGGTVLCSILDTNFNPASPELVEYIQFLICPPEAGESEPSANGYGLAPIGAMATISTAVSLGIDISTTVQISLGFSPAVIVQQIDAAIDAYLLSVRRTWDTMVTTNKIIYPVFVYVARVVSAMMLVEGVINVTDTQLNGFPNDIALIESGELQQIPTKGQVVVNVTS